MAGIDEILAVAEDPRYRRTSSARVLLRQDLEVAHGRLERELVAVAEAGASGSLADSPDSVDDLGERIAELEAEIAAAEIEFTFRSIGKKAWADLIAKHPPTKHQRAELSVDHNPETFPLAAMSASCVEPEGVDYEAVKRLEASLTDAQFTSLWAACVDANVGSQSSPKSVAAGMLRRARERSGSSAAPAASPAPSSSAA